MIVVSGGSSCQAKAAKRHGLLRVLDRLPGHAEVFRKGFDRQVRAQLKQGALKLPSHPRLRTGEKPEALVGSPPAVRAVELVNRHVQQAGGATDGNGADDALVLWVRAHIVRVAERTLKRRPADVYLRNLLGFAPFPRNDLKPVDALGKL